MLTPSTMPSTLNVGTPTSFQLTTICRLGALPFCSQLTLPPLGKKIRMGLSWKSRQ